MKPAHIKLKTLSVLEKMRKLRSKQLRDIVKPLQRIGITANHLTLLSFLSGLVAIYFLFSNHTLFVLFGIIHLFFDSIDGVLARLTNITTFGKYFDFFTDGFITIALLTKAYLFTDDYLVIIIIFLTIATQTIYFFSHFQYPILFVRTTTLILLMLHFVTLGILTAGILSLYSIALQVNHYWQLKMIGQS
jgi:phosphatidylglycerophosphate synthase